MRRSVNNRDVADLFETVADMLAIRGDQFHRILAYRKGAESIRQLGRDINQVYRAGELTDIPGIGKTLAEKIEEILTTGELRFYHKLAQEIPPALVDILRVEGVGPKKIKTFYEKLAIASLEELETAAREGKLRDLPGMGKKSEAKILASIESLARHGDGRTPLRLAWPAAQVILAQLAEVDGVQETAVAGSLRRMKETIGDIDLLVAATDTEAVMARFCDLASVESVIARGPSKSSVILHDGMQVDLRAFPRERWGTFLVYFTGSKDHNVRLRELAQKKKLSLNEHAFRAVRPDGGVDEDDVILCATEEEVYAVLDLPWIAPPLREDWGEIEAAQQGRLPDLVLLEQIVSDLHMHTTWSDGKLSVLEMARAAQGRGLQYIAITDHSGSLSIANGLSAERLQAQAEEIRAANEVLGADFRILHGTEMEIRADGSLDFPDEVLAELDFVIASLHVSLGQSQEQVTQRMLNAINNPHVDMIAHPTGRLLPDRIGADLDMERILNAAVATGTILEVNANPHRLDLRDIHVRRALELGAVIAINTDAHRAAELDLTHFGVATAQRGWAESAAVVNTWPLEKFLNYLKREA